MQVISTCLIRMYHTWQRMWKNVIKRNSIKTRRRGWHWRWLTNWTVFYFLPSFASHCLNFLTIFVSLASTCDFNRFLGWSGGGGWKDIKFHNETEIGWSLLMVAPGFSTMDFYTLLPRPLPRRMNVDVEQDWDRKKEQDGVGEERFLGVVGW